MEEKNKYYKLGIRIPCDTGGCWGEIYLSGKDLEVSHPFLGRSLIYFGSKPIESKLEEISEEEFNEVKRSKKPSDWFG